jgi:hypothetical protein
MKKIVICVLSAASYFSLLLPLFCAAEQKNILLMIPPIIAATHDNVETPDLPPVVTPFSYPGNWIGTFTGTDTGTWDAMIDDKGSMTGDGYSNDLRSKFYFEGTVDTQNNFHAKAVMAGGASTGAEFNGTVIEPGTVTGTWINKKYRESGTFTGGLRGL